MCRPQPHHKRYILLTLATFIAISALGSGRASAQPIIQIIDSSGDGAGNVFRGPRYIAVDAAGNAYVVGVTSDNAFKIWGDEDGDGVHNGIDVCSNTPVGVPVDFEGRPRGDMDDDCDIDLADHALFAQYFTGPL